MALMALVLATGLLCVTSVFAQDFVAFQTGDELFDVCNVPVNDPRHLFCVGYVAGLSDALNSQGTICTPKDISIRQTVDVILNHLRNHPERLHVAAPILTGDALGHAFPCK
jgi:Rap1a immunity proteins